MHFHNDCAEAVRKFGVFANLAPFAAELAAAEQRMSRDIVEDQRLHSDIAPIKARLNDCVERSKS